MPKGGLEPPRGCPHQVLNLARLPFRHFGSTAFYQQRDELATKSRLRWIMSAPALCAAAKFARGSDLLIDEMLLKPLRLRLVLCQRAFHCGEFPP